MGSLVHKPEVLAPAGDPTALAAAARAGADAVYFGLQDYNARIRAANFTLEDLAGVVMELHRDGVRAYVTFNTLLFESEQEAARTTIERIHAAGADAIIVQDLSVARWARAHVPDLPLHASTQMTVSSAHGIRFLERLGITRVILARELTLQEIERIRRETTMELEVFVHGALCVSYSGQCLSSEAWGGRSANRGQCAQACRLPYDLVVDGRMHPLDDRAYLLSPRDLEGYRRIPDLVAAGVHGIKIEGRMKSAEYVAAATALYRAAVDATFGALPERAADAPASEAGLERLADRTRRVFSRGTSEGFLSGIDHQHLADGRIRSHRGVLAGRISGFGPDWIEIDREPGSPDLTPGDGVLIATSAREEDETGGKIFSVEPARPSRPGRIRIGFGRGHGPSPTACAPGASVYLTFDHALQAELRRMIADPAASRHVPVTIRVAGREGATLKALYADPDGNEVEVASESPLAGGARHPLDRAVLEAHLGRLGDSRYRCVRLEAELQGDLLLPVKEMNRMRRSAVERLEAVRARGGHAPRAGGAAATAASAPQGPVASPVEDAIERAGMSAAEVATKSPSGSEDPFLVLCRTREQVVGAIDAGARRVILDFLDLVGLKDACALVRDAGAELTLALPRIQKPGEERIWDWFLHRGPDAIVVRNLASLERLAAVSGRPILVGDVSLNAVNPSSIAFLLDAGCDRVSPGLDLNAVQLGDLVARMQAERIEIPLHHHLPVFHTEHCVFAAFLSDGADWRTCGRPCDRHALHLRDRTGIDHAVIADVGCRNTVFSAKPQSVIDLLPALRAAGVRHFRLELLEQSASGAADLLSTYRALWEGTCSIAEARRRLKTDARFGVSSPSPEPARKLDWKPQGGRRPEPPRAKSPTRKGTRRPR